MAQFIGNSRFTIFISIFSNKCKIVKIFWFEYISLNTKFEYMS